MTIVRRAPWTPIEEWEDLQGYEGTYWIADTGQVISRPRRSARGGATQGGPLRHWVGTNGYPAVKLTTPGTSTQVNYLVHHLVAKAFIGPRPPGLMVCHNDGDHLNSWVGNLRYDTQRANMLDAFFHGKGRGIGLAMSRFCPDGHEFTEINSYHPPSRPEVLLCRECRRLASMNRRRLLGVKPRVFSVPRGYTEAEMALQS